MLISVNVSMPSSTMGRLDSSLTRKPRARATSRACSAVQTMTNSSPPKRESKISADRPAGELRNASTAEPNHAARLTSNTSPALWPSESFINLNRSRSQKTKATSWPPEFRVCKSSPRRCSKYARLKRPVSGSWVASWVSSRRAQLSLTAILANSAQRRPISAKVSKPVLTVVRPVSVADGADAKHSTTPVLFHRSISNSQAISATSLSSRLAFDWLSTSSMDTR
ncbi:unannotated protein [freshwater metagenome]|uniref:Unannotated protein n=1 Tax=freshwater metagenome TaxID=449393 RepID=A0A6J6TZP5_9ZZZZ